ncbi:MAG: hypothetical protein ABIQ89_03895 [Candidatus Saccharimonadales bacterium]
MDYKVFLAIVSVIMSLVAYVFYFRDIFAGKTKPHAFSWLVWTSLTAIAFAGQVSDNAGPGAWVTGVTAFVSFFIFLLAAYKGEKTITKSDKLSLLGAALALVLWFLTNSPLLSIVLITVIDFLGFLPTIRKSYHKPHEETLVTFALSGLKFVLAIIALENYSLVTWLYPASLVAANLFFVIMLKVRRKKLGPLHPF